MSAKQSGGTLAGLGASGILAVWTACGLLGCQGSTSGSAPPPASGTAVITAPESPPAGPPAATTEPANSGWNAPGSAPATSASGAPAPSGTDPTKDLVGTVPGTSTVAQMGAMAAGAKATVRGLFLGWHGPCQGTPPTRSAWQLADSDQKGAPCLYVDGPAPAGLDAAHGTPTWVRLDAELVAAGPAKYLTSKNAQKETP